MSSTKKMHSTLFAPTVLLLCLVLAGCATSGAQARPASVPEIRPGVLAGYLQPNALPDGVALIPPPPAKGSAAFALDEEVASKAIAQRGTPRWKLATEDADLDFPEAAGTFSCAMQTGITQEATPRLYTLLRRAMTDAGRSTGAPKKHYGRERPFMVNGQPICTPDDRQFLVKSPSYPSGHTAVGWAWALILAEIDPDHADAILARGRAFGESRNICNVHWHSDVVEGRFMAAGTVARLHADASFREDIEAAKAELAAARARGIAPQRDCAAEAAALAGVGGH
jgi:acid phosphatase (class A)